MSNKVIGASQAQETPPRDVHALRYDLTEQAAVGTSLPIPRLTSGRQREQARRIDHH